MIKKILKKSALLMAILMLASQASFITLPAAAAGNASLSLGGASLRNGCPGSIPINIDTGGENVWAADVAMTVSGDATINSLVTGSTLPMQTCSDSSVPDIMLCGSRQPGSGTFTGQGTYGTINVTPNSSGTISISFDNSITHVVNNDIQDVLGEAIGADYSVVERFNSEVDGTGFCNPDTTAPNIGVNPSNGQNNVPLDTSIKLTLSDDRVGIDLSTLTFSVNGIAIDTFSYTETGGTYIPPTPFDLGEKVTIEVSVCDVEGNCRQFSSSFRTTPPPPEPNCGDRNVDEGEECDAGYQTSSCDRDCTLVICGDGIINDVAGEQCDDLNLDDGDGCSSICTLEVSVEDEALCPVLKEVAPECPIFEEVPEVPEEEFEQEHFEEAALTAVEESLRPAAEVISLPSTPEEEEEIDLCILEYGAEGGNLDHDGDGLSDRTECYSETDPTEADTDDDTCLDGEEINRFYTDPLVVDCSISDYVEEEVLITDPKPNWILTSLEVFGTTPRRSLTVGVTAFPALQKTFSKVLTQYEQFLNVLRRDVDPLNTVAAQQKTGDTTDAITKLQTYIIGTQAFIDEYPESYVDLADELKQVTTFLDGGTAAVSTALGQVEALFEALNQYKIGPIFLGEVNELLIVGVGNTTTAGFNLEPENELEDGVYDLVATAGFEDGGTKSSAPVRIYLNSKVDVGRPTPQTLDGVPIGAEKIITNNQRPFLSGKVPYGATVFATWESLILESSIIADSTEGSFEVQPPRKLAIGEDHTVTVYAVTEMDEGLVRSKNTTVDFRVVRTKETTLFYSILFIALFLMLAIASNIAQRKMKRKKRNANLINKKL